MNPCFNPSSIGNRPQSEYVLAPFTVVFSSFNPSSIGNRPQSCAGCCGCNAVHEFQSFFYWKSASKTKREFEAVELYKFQSFFYWKSASKRSFSTRLPSLVMSFNPSSIGNRPQRPVESRPVSQARWVSILLLLEIGLKALSLSGRM